MEQHSLWALAQASVGARPRPAPRPLEFQPSDVAPQAMSLRPRRSTTTSLLQRKSKETSAARGRVGLERTMVRHVRFQHYYYCYYY